MTKDSRPNLRTKQQIVAPFSIYWVCTILFLEKRVQVHISPRKRTNPLISAPLPPIWQKTTEFDITSHNVWGWSYTTKPSFKGCFLSLIVILTINWCWICNVRGSVKTLVNTSLFSVINTFLNKRCFELSFECLQNVLEFGRSYILCLLILFEFECCFRSPDTYDWNHKWVL